MESWKQELDKLTEQYKQSITPKHDFSDLFRDFMTQAEKMEIPEDAKVEHRVYCAFCLGVLSSYLDKIQQIN